MRFWKAILWVLFFFWLVYVWLFSLLEKSLYQHECKVCTNHMHVLFSSLYSLWQWHWNADITDQMSSTLEQAESISHQMASAFQYKYFIVSSCMSILVFSVRWDWGLWRRWLNCMWLHIMVVGQQAWVGIFYFDRQDPLFCSLKVRTL